MLVSAYYRLKVYEMRLETNFWLSVQPMGNRHDYAINGMIFDFIGTGSGVAVCDWRRNFFKKEDGISF